MKIKVKKINGAIIVDYFKAKNINEFRFGVLEYLVGISKESLILFVDTNSSIKKIPIEDIEKTLKFFCKEHFAEHIVSTKKNIFGFTFPTKGKKKPEKSESLIALKVDKDRFSKELYEDFLQYYDYGIGVGCRKSTQEMLNLFSEDWDSVLFNKEVLEASFYDSILFSRLRTDSTDAGLERYLEEKSR